MKTRYLTLLCFCLGFELLAIFTSKQGFHPEPLLLLSLAFAASLVGRAIAYLTIFEWLRAPFTLASEHSSGAGVSVEPRSDRGPVVAVIGAWMACPICAGTWGAMGLLAVFALEPELGRTMIYVLGAASFGSLLTRLAEKLEWEGRYYWEQTGALNRLNKEQAMLQFPISTNTLEVKR